ncbi:polyprenal reductase isoform X2 [Rhodnius prolixus]|uniref:polyprenal reductase isoform X2 n=1 Tax=Rhodnius prolixus TaxID=13249 RepID=UPI003D1885E1
MFENYIYFTTNKIEDDTFLYGKFDNVKVQDSFSPKVPKRWFKHFYVFGSLWVSVFLVVLSSYYLHILDTIPGSLKNLISYFSSSENRSTATAAESLVALILLSFQIFKRYYETHYVSVFSNAKMHIGHYYLGFFHYFGTVVAIVMESPGFSYSDNFEAAFHFKDLSYRTLVVSLIFFWAWWKQFESASILANLRKNRKGVIVTDAYLIPEGGLFKYISSPHSLCEIIIYLCLTIILSDNSTLPSVAAWVISNQIESALLSHWWYKRTFTNYPEKRKAIIPFFL